MNGTGSGRRSFLALLLVLAPGFAPAVAEGQARCDVQAGTCTLLGEEPSYGDLCPVDPPGKTETFETFLRHHLVVCDEGGRLQTSGDTATTDADLRRIFHGNCLRRFGAQPMRGVLLHAHGGLTGTDTAIERVARYKQLIMAEGIYPVVFAWKTDVGTTFKYVFQSFLLRFLPNLGRTLATVVGHLGANLFALFKGDAMPYDRDRILEDGLRTSGARLFWDKMKENAIGASRDERGGARLVAGHLAALRAKNPAFEIHMIGHSAGAVFLAHLTQLLTTRGVIARGPLRGIAGHGLTIQTCQLKGAACTVDLFRSTYLPALEAGAIEHFTLFNLADRCERSDGRFGYARSVLYLLRQALEARRETPILGMELAFQEDPTLRALAGRGVVDRVVCPNEEPEGSPSESRASTHGDLATDPATQRATKARILAGSRRVGVTGEATE